MRLINLAMPLGAFPDASPWQVCFAVGLGWGHLAKIDLTFTEAALRVLSENDQDALKVAKTFHLERGPSPIEQSLGGGYLMFQRVRLPKELPEDLKKLRRAQERWLSPILSPTIERPKYIGSWNATAMFMVALFANPALAADLLEPEVMLPPNGPIFLALNTLYRGHVLSTRPAGSELDDQAFEPGAIYENNGLMAELLKGRLGWSMIDLHSGLYMLGTRYPHSAQWA